MAPTPMQFIPGRLDWLLGAAGSPRGRRLGAACLLLSVAVLGATAFEAWSRRDMLVQRQRQLALATSPRGPVPEVAAAAASAPVLRPADAARLNLVVRRLNTPWAAIFDALERQASPLATVLAVEPDVERGAIRIVTEGQRLDDLLRHAAQVPDVPRFSQVQLLRIDTAEAGEPRRPRLTFDLVLAP